LQITFGSIFNIDHWHSDFMLHHHKFRDFLVLFCGFLELHLWEPCWQSNATSTQTAEAYIDVVETLNELNSGALSTTALTNECHSFSMFNVQAQSIKNLNMEHSCITTCHKPSTSNCVQNKKFWTVKVTSHWLLFKLRKITQKKAVGSKALFLRRWNVQPKNPEHLEWILASSTSKISEWKLVENC